MIKKKIIFKRWFCRHIFKSAEGLRGFFGMTQCLKCGEWGQLPDEQMTTTTFKFPKIIFKVTPTGK